MFDDLGIKPRVKFMWKVVAKLFIMYSFSTKKIYMKSEERNVEQ